MRIALFGATGRLGQHLLPLLRRHDVSCLVRGSADRILARGNETRVKVIVGDACDPAASQDVVHGADVVISMLTPLPTDHSFIDSHVDLTSTVVRATTIEQARRKGEDATPSGPRLIVVGGAGVMSRSSGEFVTDTLPGAMVKRVLPIYGSFFEAHKTNLKVLQSSSLQWTMLCPGFLRDFESTSNSSTSCLPDGVRLWKDVNDERLGGLSVT